MSEVTPQPKTGQVETDLAPSAATLPRGQVPRGVGPRLPSRRIVVGQQTGAPPCPTCGPGESQTGEPPSYVFAIGQVRLRFPSPSVEKEFVQRIAELPGTPGGRSDAQAYYDALNEYPYLRNEVCWSFVIDGVETYLLLGRDQRISDQFVEAVKPTERALDTDVIVGMRGPMAPPEMCNGLVVPVVLVDRISSFQKPEMMSALSAAISGSAGTSAQGSGSRRGGGEDGGPPPPSDDGLRQSADELFERIQQLADNVGGTDEHRAVNYLAMHSAQIYAQTAEMYARDFTLSRVEVGPSRLATTRKLVNVIFTYTNRRTDVEEKYRVRVDVTEKYPFIERKLSQYYDRD